DLRGRSHLDPIVARDLDDGDDRLRAVDALLHAVDEVDASGLDLRVGRNRELRGLGQRLRANEREGLHDRAPLESRSFTAASTTSGVIGICLIRTPSACDTALAIAAAVGTVEGSPMPTELVLLTPSQTDTSMTSISGTSREPAILYAS